MKPQAPDISTLRPDQLAKLPGDQFRYILGKLLEIDAADRQDVAIRHYRPASELSRRVHHCTAGTVGISGGNRSSKTETALAELVALATGVMPEDEDVRAALLPKFRGPVNIRIVVESLTTTLHPIILPKLQYWRWTGISQPGGPKGHWGYVPRHCLEKGLWSKAWSEKLRTLTVKCFNPAKPESTRPLGYSMIQFMSFDQDPSDFASGTFHHVLHDEPPPYAIWRENKARVWDVRGRMMLAMTWPDDPAIPVEWIYDEVYEKGVPGPRKDPDVEWFELQTLDNIHLDQDHIRSEMGKLDEVTRKVRMLGKPIRFSNRIHPLFTDTDSFWSFSQGREIWPDDGKETADIVRFNHVVSRETFAGWPVVFLLDPHPRKPHMGLWVVVDPNDDLHVVAEMLLDGDPVDVKTAADAVEEERDFRVTRRLIDPNMGRSPASARRSIDSTWQDEFDDVGLQLDLADDGSAGRQKINQYLKPDQSTGRPQLTIDPNCTTTISQMKRYVWDDYKRGMDRDQKQTAKDKNDDMPTLLKYLLNDEPTFAWLRDGPPIITRTGTRRGAY